jgi:hypothetical protein
VGLHYTKKLYTAKETIEKNEKVAHRLGNICKPYICISKIYKELTKFTSKQKKKEQQTNKLEVISMAQWVLLSDLPLSSRFLFIAILL